MRSAWAFAGAGAGERTAAAASRELGVWKQTAYTFLSFDGSLLESLMCRDMCDIQCFITSTLHNRLIPESMAFSYASRTNNFSE